jgi:iron complex outermembrane receptor protein
MSMTNAVHSPGSNHGEFKSDGDPADRVVGRRHWVSLQLEF